MVNSPTESLCIAYLPAYSSDDKQARLRTTASISRAVVRYCGTRPFKIVALPESLLQKSSLGKLSRSKIQRAFEDGAYLEYESKDNTTLETSRKDAAETFTGTATQKIILEAFNQLFTSGSSHLGVDIHIGSDMFELGFSSIDMLKLKVYLQKALNIRDIPITIFFSNPVLGQLGHAIDNLKKGDLVTVLESHKESVYDPITVLQRRGSKTPLFLIHPGMGDVLVYMNLARLFDDRPVYALRARGFDGEKYYSSLEEIITLYHNAIKRVQPRGPYALGGYAIGCIIVFEIAKVMEKNGDDVKFLAVIDHGPRLKGWARTNDWYDCVVAISFFLGFVNKDFVRDVSNLREKSHEEALDYIFTLAHPARPDEVGMTRERLDSWAKLVNNLVSLFRDYDPEGSVENLDVIVEDPLQASEWSTPPEGLLQWREFGKNTRIHQVTGSHETMIEPPHVHGLQRLLEKLMGERGL
jgi:thioesterase domain-containing protein